MTTKPTPIQARAYADALIAWSDGKKVEMRDVTSQSLDASWKPFDGFYRQGFEYRVVPDPPKAREWWVENRAGDLCCESHGCSCHIALTHAPRSFSDEAIRNNYSYAREILDNEIVVGKAEYEELCRNEAALKAAIKECSNQLKRSLPLDFYLDSHGAKL
jgi:hypothetical protein